MVGVANGLAFIRADGVASNLTLVFPADHKLYSFNFEPDLSSFASIGAYWNRIAIAFVADQIVFANVVALVGQEGNCLLYTSDAADE